MLNIWQIVKNLFSREPGLIVSNDPVPAPAKESDESNECGKGPKTAILADSVVETVGGTGECGQKKIISRSGEELVAGVCGHKTFERAVVSIYGNEITLKLLEGDIDPGYCLDCMIEASILCAWCKNIIMPDDPVTLYTANKDFIPPRGSKSFVYAENHELVEVTDHSSCKSGVVFAGCLECCNCAADRVGFWVRPGKILTVMSPLRVALEIGEVCGDAYDIDEAIRLQNKVLALRQKRG